MLIRGLSAGTAEVTSLKTEEKKFKLFHINSFFSKNIIKFKITTTDFGFFFHNRIYHDRKFRKSIFVYEILFSLILYRFSKLKLFSWSGSLWNDSINPDEFYFVIFS